MGLRQGLARSLLGSAIAVYAVTLVCGLVLLPPRVEVYFTPATGADVVYAVWQYLALVTVGTALVAVAAAAVVRAGSALAAVFGSEQARSGEAPSLLVGAWTLVCGAASIWLAAWLGNDASRRSGFELVGALAWLAGVVVIGGLGVARSVRRG